MAKVGTDTATPAAACTQARRHPCPRGSCAEHRVAIAAPIDRVWAILADFGHWGDWNPLYIKTAGRLAEGERIDVTVALAGMKPQVGQATVTLVQQPICIEYNISSLGGLVRAFRYIELKATGPDSCRIANGEIMSRPVGKLTASVMCPKLRAGLKGMNEALKARAEA